MLSRYEYSAGGFGQCELSVKFEFDSFCDVYKQLDSDVSELFSRLGVESKGYTITPPDRVIFDGPATITFWPDGTKTVVKCADGDHYDKRIAILWCFMKKMFGNNTQVNKMLDNLIEDDE